MRTAQLPDRLVRIGVSGAVGAAVLIGSACAAATQSRWDDGGLEPLDARLYAPIAGHLQFAVSRPAYVAIFEVSPGRGMSMLFPTSSFDVQRRFGPGSHSLVPQSFSLGRSLYREISHGGVYEPTYLVLIAAERPLRVQRMVHMPSTLLTELGFATFYSMANIHALYRLAESIVPDPERTEWTYDTYVLWPTVQSSAIAFRVACPDGPRMVRGGFIPEDCLRRSATTSPPPTDTTKRDSTEFPSPIPRVRPPSSKPGAGGAAAFDRERSGAGDRSTENAARLRGGRRSEGRAAPGSARDVERRSDPTPAPRSVPQRETGRRSEGVSTPARDGPAPMRESTPAVRPAAGRERAEPARDRPAAGPSEKRGSGPATQ